MDSDITFRKFTPADAPFCHRTRSAAYGKLFVDELGADTAAAATRAYRPDDYLRLARLQECFIVEQQNIPVGFFTLCRHAPETAEIPLIYLDLHHLHKGLGSACIRFAEDWIHSHWPAVRELFVDTIIPDYNAGFYRKLGFSPAGNVPCHFPGVCVPALRLSKDLSLTR
ncbi:MAG: GNAT family N-acetyltransferase [Fidelibacterota bacterium]|nr:MAG: GNAT family N-acetyltransferase [Candidatus Neomarinimicrobiota bacterium]